jgi:hypothetical protein
MEVTYELEMDNGKSIFCVRSGSALRVLKTALSKRNLPLEEGQSFKGNGYTCTVRVVKE